jgi:hypothetical protein
MPAPAVHTQSSKSIQRLNSPPHSPRVRPELVKLFFVATKRRITVVTGLPAVVNASRHRSIEVDADGRPWNSNSIFLASGSTPENGTPESHNARSARWELP